MANQLDLEEQEQLDQLKAFWSQYGSYITWALIAVLGSFAGWNLYQRWQTSQASQAAGLYDELDRVVAGKDVAKVERVFGDLKDKFPSTIQAQQGALVAAKVYFEAAKFDQAKAALTWVAEKSSDAGYQAIAKLRLAAVLLETKSYDEALKQLEGGFPSEYTALVADRKGDIFSLQGKKAEARSEYEKSFAAMDERIEYRRLVEVKLGALGGTAKPQTTAVPEGKK